MAKSIIYGTAERTLRSDPHIREIIEGDLEQIPEIRLDLWSGNPCERIKAAIGDIGEFLASPYIVDDFETAHDQRRRWQDAFISIHPELEEIFNRNSLRRRAFLHMPLWVDEFVEGYVGPNFDQLRELKDGVYRNFPDEKYHLLSTKEKIEAINGMKQRARRLLTFLSNPQPSQPE